MKVKMSKAFEIEALCKKLSTELLPLKVSYKIAKGLIVINEQIDFFKSQYAIYLKMFAQTDEEGKYVITEEGGIKIVPGAEAECARKFKELDNFEFDLPNFTFTLDEFEGLNLSLADVQVLAPFIIE